MTKLLTTIFLIGAVASGCFAQTESLLIGPGDLVNVDVFDTSQMAQQVRVSDAGSVRLQFIGDLKFEGETPSSAAKLVEKALIDKKIMWEPHVTIKVEDYATQNVSVLGQVHNPGSFPITTPQPVLKVLSLAGGLTDVADRNVTIKRHGDASTTVQYYLSNDAGKAVSETVMVYPGDIVLASKAPIVYVMGDVGKPGGYAITTNDSHLTVLQAIAMAGSANKTSIKSRVKLIRKTPQGRQELPVQLAAMEKGKQPDIILQPDDVLFVPFSWIKNTAMNASAIAASTSSAAIYRIF